MEGGAGRSGGVVAGLIEVGWREEGWCAVFPSSLRLVSFFFLFSSSFFPPSSPRGDQHPLANAVSEQGEEQDREGECRASARLTGVTLTVASMWKGSVVAAKERACTGLDLSLTLSLSHARTLSLSLTLSHSLSPPASLLLSLQCPKVVG